MDDTSTRRRQDSLTSHRYYRADTVDQKLRDLIETAESAKPKNLRVKPSKHLPFYIWFLIAKCNGVPLKPDDKPILGYFLHILTFVCAFVYALSYTWYVVYDIMSPHTPRDIAGGSASILLVFCWCAFGFYCKTLVSRLFFHQRFLKDVRMHSRTLFKINASFLALILGILFTAAKIYETVDSFLIDDTCGEIELQPYACYALSYSSMAFTLFTLVWHTLLSFVFMSVCRTHTMGLRCFIQELDNDSTLFQCHHSAKYKKIAKDDPYLDSDCENDTLTPSEIQRMDMHHNQNFSSVANNNAKHEESGEIGIILSPVSNNLLDSIELCDPCNGREGNGFQSRRLVNLAAGEDECTTAHFNFMSPAEILHNFWKLSRRLRFSSSAMQRWFASFVAIVLLRCSTYLVYWLGHPAKVFDVLQFVLPLILLVVLSSALAEVNFEGQRFLRSVYPSEERLKVVQYLSFSPLQMPIYGFGMTHGTIVTVIFAILVGFVTRIVITEITK